MVGGRPKSGTNADWSRGKLWKPRKQATRRTWRQKMVCPFKGVDALKMADRK